MQQSLSQVPPVPAEVQKVVAYCCVLLRILFRLLACLLDINPHSRNSCSVIFICYLGNKAADRCVADSGLSLRWVRLTCGSLTLLFRDTLTPCHSEAALWPKNPQNLCLTKPVTRYTTKYFACG